MNSNLPLEVLGWMGPILCWIEGAEGLRFPQTWLADSLTAKKREQAWLIRELPTYSYDNADEIVRLRLPRDAEGAGRSPWSQPWPPAAKGKRRLSPPPGYDLSEALLHLGKRYFTWNGSELCVREGYLEELHELALRFPVAHLIRRMHAEAAASGYISADRALKLPEQLSLLHTTSHGLYTVVHRGVSEGHLHLWGVTSATEIWADQLLLSAIPETLADFQEEDRRLFVLSRAGVRLLALGLLFPFLRSRSPRTGPQKGPEDPEGFHLPFDLISLLDESYLARNLGEDWVVRRRLREEFRAATKNATSQEGAARTELDWLLRLIDPSARRQLWSVTQGRTGLRGRPKPEGIRQRIELLERLHFEIQRLLIALPTRAPEGEVMPAKYALRQFLHEAFFRYLVFQTHHWQLATQSGTTTGLRQFQRFYRAQQRRTLAPKGAEEQGMIFERFRDTACLRTVEGRVSPPANPQELVPWVLGYAEAIEKKQLDSFGLVIHFVKANYGKADAPTARAGSRSVRYGYIRRKTQGTAFRLAQLLSTPHPAVPFIVGIDAANLELPTPPEVFAPAFRFLREYPIEVRSVEPRVKRFGAFREIASLAENRRLRMTYHVGEEFRHLLSGLRAIAEAIEFLDARPGDRIGHGIALALKPDVWAEQTGYQAVLPKQEWLDTLVWVYHFLGSGNPLLAELAVEDEIQRLSRSVYGAAGRNSDWPLPTLYDAWKLRQLDPYSVDLDCDRLKKLGSEPPLRKRTRHGIHHRRWAHVQAEVLRKVNKNVGSNAAYELLGLYWHHANVKREGARIITIDMQDQRKAWLRLCHEVQAKLKNLVQKSELVIEVNPSSNRLIGPLSQLSEHPVFRLTLDADNRLSRDVRVTINTDDPGVFNTSLAHEYYLLGEILQHRRDVPETEVVEWLEWLRQNGNDSSFVRVLPPPDDPRIQKILSILKRDSQRVQDRLHGSRYAGFWERLAARRRTYERESLQDLRASFGDGELTPDRINQLMRDLKTFKKEKARSQPSS